MGPEGTAKLTWTTVVHKAPSGDQNQLLWMSIVEFEDNVASWIPLSQLLTVAQEKVQHSEVFYSHYVGDVFLPIIRLNLELMEMTFVKHACQHVL